MLAMAHGVAVPVSSTELARGPHSSHRVYNATIVLLYHRPRLMIAESGTQTRARPTRSRRLETAETANKRAALDLAIIGVLADGGLRRSEAAALSWGDVELWDDGTGRITVQKGKNQPAPPTVAFTESTARALQEILPKDSDPAAAVFGLTGEALANRVRAAARAAGLGDGFTGHSGRIGMARRMVAAGAPNAAVQRQGRWKNGNMVARYTRGESAGEALKWLT